MKLHFSYNLDKDVENVINGSRSVNNKKPTGFQLLFAEKNGDILDAEKISAFIEEMDVVSGLDMNKEISVVEKRWENIEAVFIDRVEKLFGISYPSPVIVVYLTHNERCTYNIEENYFFVKIGSDFSNNIIIHELLHFYTLYAFGMKLMNEGLSKSTYNDIKESLTELLNLEFSDLMGGKPDMGYPQHEGLRAKIRTSWLVEKNLPVLVEKLVSDHESIP